MTNDMFEPPPADFDRVQGLPPLDADQRRAIEKRLRAAHEAWVQHYTGNCFGCDRCSNPPTLESVAREYLAETGRGRA